MKMYVGHPNDRDWQVYVRDVRGHPLFGLEANSKLRNRTDLANHSPDGFSWGYGGSGVAQLSLSLLADALGDADRALSLYQDFKWLVLARLPQEEPWAMSETIVRRLADYVDRVQQQSRGEA